MSTHRELYPAQYTHSLVGSRVRHDESGTVGTVERVVESRFGQLAILREYGAEQAWAVNTLRRVGK